MWIAGRPSWLAGAEPCFSVATVPCKRAKPVAGVAGVQRVTTIMLLPEEEHGVAGDKQSEWAG